MNTSKDDRLREGTARSEQGQTEQDDRGRLAVENGQQIVGRRHGRKPKFQVNSRPIKRLPFFKRNYDKFRS